MNCPCGKDHTGERSGYYVSAIRGNRTGLLLGPYRTHAEALDKVELGRRLASRVDPWSDFDAFGTCRVEGGTHPGRLNDLAFREDAEPY